MRSIAELSAPRPATAGAAGSIVGIRPALDHEWDDVWSRADHATYFHSRWWAESWRDGTGGVYRPAPLLVTLGGGARAVLPFSWQRLRKGLLRRTVSSPAGTYGGWIAPASLAPESLAALRRVFDEPRGALVWRASPFDPSHVRPGDAVSGHDEADGAASGPDVTHALDLRAGHDAIRAAWARRGGAILRKAKKASRAGVVVRRAESVSEWRDYYGLYEESLARWRSSATSRHPWSLFEAIHATRTGRETLWVAEREGEILAGALCFSGPRVVAYWHGAARSESFNLRPVNLLMCEIIHDACASAADWFDFGPSGPHEGVAAFKRSYGATPIPCPLHRTRPALHRLAGV